MERRKTIINNLQLALAPNAPITKEWLEAIVIKAKKTWKVGFEMLASAMKEVCRKRRILIFGIPTQLQKVWLSTC